MRLAELAYGNLRTLLRGLTTKLGVKLDEGTEAYSSKMCPCCGRHATDKDMNLSKREDGDRWFKCPKDAGGCGFKGVRDFKAAFTIMLMHLNADQFAASLTTVRKGAAAATTTTTTTTTATATATATATTTAATTTTTKAASTTRKR